MADATTSRERAPRAAADGGRFSSHAFVIGSARSGTTWTQLLLAQHPRIATSRETHIFSRYLGQLLASYDADAKRETRRGVTLHLSRDEMLDVCALACERLMTKIADQIPGSDVLLQKIPDVGGDAALVHALFPAARFVHVIRDPRAVVASLRAGAAGWAKDWAPSGTVRATELWRKAVSTARTIPQLTPAYLEIRYEALHTAPVETLTEVHRFLGLETDPARCEAAFAACRIEDLRERRSTMRAPWDVNAHREGFFRRGERDAWRDELRPRDVRLVESTAWDLMQELGYAPVHARRPRGSLRVWSHRKARHVAHQIERVGRGLAGWLDRRSP